MNLKKPEKYQKYFEKVPEIVSSYGGKIYKYKLDEPFDYDIKDLISYKFYNR